MTDETSAKYAKKRRAKGNLILASLCAFDPLLSVAYLGMLLAASAQIRSKDATPTTPKF